MTANIIDGCGGMGNVLMRRIAEQGNRSEGRRDVGQQERRLAARL